MREVVPGNTHRGGAVHYVVCFSGHRNPGRRNATIRGPVLFGWVPVLLSQTGISEARKLREATAFILAHVVPQYTLWGSEGRR